MRLRKLPIAWSVVWGVAAVLLVVLWGRSYWIADDISIYGNSNGVLGLGADHGSVTFVNMHSYVLRRGLMWEHDARYPTISPLGFQWFSTPYATNLFIPFGYPVVAFVALSVMPWIRWSNRFTLRATLIATALAAIALGLIVYAVRA